MKAKIVGISIVCLLSLIVLGWGLRALGVIEYSVFIPWEQNVKREVFQNTDSYTKGKNQDLARYYEQYMKAKDETEKSAILSLVRMNLADFDPNKVKNPTLRAFLLQVIEGN